MAFPTKESNNFSHKLATSRRTKKELAHGQIRSCAISLSVAYFVDQFSRTLFDPTEHQSAFTATERKVVKRAVLQFAPTTNTICRPRKSATNAAFNLTLLGDTRTREMVILARRLEQVRRFDLKQIIVNSSDKRSF